MLNIIRYDFKRKLNKYCTVTIAIAALAIVALHVIFASLSVYPFMVLAPLILPWFYIADATAAFHDELNGKYRYMLFMTPHSGYTIIMAKLVSCILFGLALIILCVAFVSVNGYFLVQETDTGREAFPDIIQNIADFLYQYDYRCVLFYTFTACVLVVTFTLTIFMLEVLSNSLLSESYYRKGIALFVFLLIMYCGAQGVYTIVKFHDQTLVNYDFYVNASRIGRSIITTTPPLILALIYCAIITRFTGYLLEKRINL